MSTVEENQACRSGDEIHIYPLVIPRVGCVYQLVNMVSVVEDIRPTFRMLSIGRRVSRQASHRGRGPTSSETKRVQV